MRQLFYYLKRAVSTVRAFRAFGHTAITRLLACGSGMSVEVVGPSKIDIGARVTFGNDCGIAVISRTGRAPAELSIGTKTSFQSRLSLNCFVKVDIGSHCAISWDVHIMDTDFHQIIYEGGVEPSSSSAVCIGDRVWIGARVTILKGVTIGSDSMIAAGSIVTKSFPAYSLIGGNPARRIKSIQGWKL